MRSECDVPKTGISEREPKRIKVEMLSPKNDTMYKHSPVVALVPLVLSSIDVQTNFA